MRPKLASSVIAASPSISMISMVTVTLLDSAIGVPLSVIVTVKACWILVSKSKGLVPFTVITPLDGSI